MSGMVPRQGCSYPVPLIIENDVILDLLKTFARIFPSRLYSRSIRWRVMLERKILVGICLARVLFAPVFLFLGNETRVTGAFLARPSFLTAFAATAPVRGFFSS